LALNFSINILEESILLHIKERGVPSLREGRVLSFPWENFFCLIRYPATSALV